MSYEDPWDGETPERQEIATLKSALATARETNRRLNRRAQLADAALAEPLSAGEPGRRTFGRALANYAAAKREARVAQLEHRLARVLVQGERFRCWAFGQNSRGVWSSRRKERGT